MGKRTEYMNQEQEDIIEMSYLEGQISMIEILDEAIVNRGTSSRPIEEILRNYGLLKNEQLARIIKRNKK